MPTIRREETDGMEVDWGRLLVGQLEFYWDVHLRPRLDGLTDAVAGAVSPAGDHHRLADGPRRSGLPRQSTWAKRLRHGRRRPELTLIQAHV
jgi:hypothetical protein